MQELRDLDLSELLVPVRLQVVCDPQRHGQRAGQHIDRVNAAFA
jgi:hypothetical protein